MAGGPNSWSDGTYDYMSHPAFWAKWGVIAHYIRLYGTKPYRILDLGCGKPKLLDELGDIERYVGIDSAEEVMKSNQEKYSERKFEFVTGDYKKFDTDTLHGKFNCIIWAGIQDQPHEYDNILMQYMPILETGGLIIFDYMILPLVAIQNRITLLFPRLKQLDGCYLMLPFVPEETRKVWPRVNERVIGVFQK